MLVVPLMLGAKPIGVLRVYSSEIRKFDGDEIRFLEAVASLSAIALENARMHKGLRTDFDLLRHRDEPGGHLLRQGPAVDG